MIRTLCILLLAWIGALNAFAQTAEHELQRYLAQSRKLEQTQPDSAVFYANRGIQLAEQLRNQIAISDFLLQLGEINALHKHKDLARKFYNQALGTFRRIHDAAGIARSYDALGLLDHDNGEFGRALQYYRDSRDSTGIIATYIGMGKAAEENNDSGKALSYYLRALTQYEHRKHRPEAYYSLIETIGRIYERQGNTEMALHYFQEGIRDSIPVSAAHLRNATGEAFEQRHDEKAALATYKRALADARKNRQSDEQAEALLHIAGILKKTDAGSSISDLKQALSIAQSLNQAELKARIYAALAAVYRQQKDYGEAMLALDAQHHLVDSLLNVDTVKEITALDNSYALESSQEQVHNLQRINRLEAIMLWCGLVVVLIIAGLLILLWRYLKKTKQLNMELTASNRVKDTLFSVVGHDLKGPAGSAAQLFELMDTEELPPEEMKLMVKELRKQTAASLELLQALFEWGKAQLQGVKVQPVDFNPLPVVERCIHLLSQQAALKGIHLENQLSEYLNLHADVNHYEFIIRNLLSNAIKFSYEGGHIVIGTQVPVNTGEVVFSVSDEGIDISPDQQTIFLSGNLKVNFGTQKEKGSGLGLLLTKDFIKANRGRIWLESQPGKGSTFYVAMPAS